MGATIYDLLDRYVEVYGKEAIWPVARTDIGNIATTPCLFEPEIMRAYAVRGTELFIRRGTAIGGIQTRIDFQAQCMCNGIYGILVNHAVTPSQEQLADLNCGWSCIIDNRGNVVAEANSVQETIVTAVIPIAEYRRKHSIPVLTKEIYQPLFEEYESKYPPNMFAQGVPQDLSEAGEMLKRQIRW